MNALRLHMKLVRRLRKLLPPGLAGKVALAAPDAGWSGSPLARLALGAAGNGCLRLRLDRVVAAAVRQHGMAGLPAAPDWSGWQPLGRRRLHFKAVQPEERQVLLLDALHECVWLLWREPSPMRMNRKY